MGSATAAECTEVLLRTNDVPPRGGRAAGSSRGLRRPLRAALHNCSSCEPKQTLTLIVRFVLRHRKATNQFQHLTPTTRATSGVGVPQPLRGLWAWAVQTQRRARATLPGKSSPTSSQSGGASAAPNNGAPSSQGSLGGPVQAAGAPTFAEMVSMYSANQDCEERTP